MATWFAALRTIAHGLQWHTLLVIPYWLVIGVLIVGPLTSYSAARQKRRPPASPDDTAARIDRRALKRSAKIEQRGYL
jgi:hypothetical protein